MSAHFLNGNLVTEDQLLISPRDLGFSRGYAVFDFLRTYNHKPFKLQEHVDRLFNSAKLIGLSMPWQKEQIKLWVLETLKTNHDNELYIRIIVSGGISSNMLPAATPTIAILVDPATKYPKEWYTKGVKAITVNYERYEPIAKSNNYIEGVKQAQLAKELGVFEPIYYSDKQVFEGSNSSVFAVVNNRLLTPKTNILPGVTRATLLEILKLKIPVEVRDFTIKELRDASEVFLTASGKEIVPIVLIDNMPIGDGNVGSITKEVIRQFAQYTKSNLW